MIVQLLMIISRMCQYIFAILIINSSQLIQETYELIRQCKLLKNIYTIFSIPDISYIPMFEILQNIYIQNKAKKKYKTKSKKQQIQIKMQYSISPNNKNRNSNKKYIRKTVSNCKLPHSSIHNYQDIDQHTNYRQMHDRLNLTHVKTYTHTQTQRFNSNLIFGDSLSSLQRITTAIPIYLLYKDKKFVVKVNKGIGYGQVSHILYKQIINYQLFTHKYSPNNTNIKQQVKNITSNVLGFSTVCNNLKIDYLLSIGEGVVNRSLLLDCFMKKEDRKQNHRVLKLRNTINSSNITNNIQNKTKRAQTIKFNYQLYSCLAIGGFSKVYLARSYEDGQFYVIKFIKKKKQNIQYNRISVYNQMQISSQFNHPFIVKMKQGLQTNRFYAMVFQYCPGGQLFYLLKNNKCMSQDNARFYFIQILLGIQHIHQKGILYRDLKPQNILIDKQGNLKIVDFGLSKKVSSNKEKTYSYCGSAQYMAPEMILRTGHNASIDYYSLGALLYQLVTGLPPFYSRNQQQLQQSIITQDLDFPSNISLSNQIKDFLAHLLTKDQKYRLGAYSGIKQIMFHPWVGKFKPNQYINKKSKKVPFIPNLEQHNFDIDQLGDDYEQFTQEIKKDLSSKNQHQIKVVVKKQEKGNHYEMISKLVDQVAENYIEPVQYFRQLATKTQHVHKLPIRQIINSTQHKNKQSSRDILTSKLKKSLQKQTQPHLQQLKKSAQKNTTLLKNLVGISPKNKENSGRLYQSYQKLLPYFNKNKIIKPNKFKVLPKANILKLKQGINDTKYYVKQKDRWIGL